MLMVVQRVVEFCKRAFEVGKARPAGSRWTKIRRHVFRENQIEKVPLMSVEGEAIEIQDLDNRSLVLLDHSLCSPYVQAIELKGASL